MQLTVVNHAFAGGKDAQRLARQLTEDADLSDADNARTAEDADKSLDLLIAQASVRNPAPGQM